MIEPGSRPGKPGALAGETCSRCGATFECGMKAGAERCWCAELPPLAPDPALGSCLCPRCLAEASARQAAAR